MTASDPNTPTSTRPSHAREWEPHEGTWLGCRTNSPTGPGKFAPIPWAFAEIVRHLARVELVFLSLRIANPKRAFRTILKNLTSISTPLRFSACPLIAAGCAIRAHLRENAAAKSLSTISSFNGWAKYNNHKKDAQIVARAKQITEANSLLTNAQRRRCVLEAGSIDVNGRGTLLTTEECCKAISGMQSRFPA